MTQSQPTSNATHGAARFRGDLESIIEGHSVVHRSPATIWQDGLYLGNGDLAATVHGGPERTRILLNKGDIWDERADWLDDMYSPEQFDWQRLKDVLTRAIDTGDWSEYEGMPSPRAKVREGDSRFYPCYQPAGYLEILGEPGAGPGFHQQLSFYRARVDCSFESGQSQYGYTVYAHADRNLISAELRTQDPGAWPLGFRLHRNLVSFQPDKKADPALQDPEFGSDGDAMWLTMAFPDGFAYAVVMHAPGLELDFEPDEGGVTAWIRDRSESVVQVRLTIVTGQDAAADQLVARGREQLQGLPAEDTLVASHEKWWADFWKKGWVSLPDKLIENLWYAEVYKMASCSRKGGQAPGQLAYWNGFSDPPWRGDYHTNINVQENYWPIYTANRPELGWPFYDLYLGILDFMIEDTKRYTGMPGARFVRGHGRSGRPNGRGPNWEMWPGAGPWLCAHFWWHYQFTLDKEFLEGCYRMFKACLEYFVAYVGAPDKSGRYNVIPSLAHEQTSRPPRRGTGHAWGKNSSYDLGILRDHLMRTISASEILEVDEAEREGWRHLLENLAPYPVSEGGYFQEWEGVDLWESHRHLSPLYPIYPGEEMHQGSAPDLVEVGRRSVQRFVDRGSDAYTGFSFGWLAAAAARMGMADIALDALQDHIKAFVNVNGFSMLGPSQAPGLAPYMANRGPGWDTKLPNCESGGCFCAGINELLLCSPSGNLASTPVIRVFPAVTDGWSDVRFSRLRAQGAFLVTAERRGGSTAYVLLESEAGARCQLASPWPGATVAVVDGDGQEVSTQRDGEVIVFETGAGEWYLVYPRDEDPGRLELVDLRADTEGGVRLGIGAPSGPRD